MQVKDSKVFKYKFVCSSKFSKTLAAKHLLMFTEVNPLFVHNSRKDRFKVLKITERSDIYHVHQC